MEPHFIEDDEQEKVRQWWKANRVPVISGIVLGLAIILGTNWWRDYRDNHAAQASGLFEEVLASDTAGNSDLALGKADELRQGFADTPYAGKASLVAGRIYFQRGDTARAREALQWALNESDQFETAYAARLRLATLDYGEGNYQQALDVLSVPDMLGFESHFHELRGDIYLRLQQPDKARAAYRAAIDGLNAGSLYEPVLRMKLDAIAAGGEPA